MERDTQWGKTSHVPLYGWCHMIQAGDHEPEFDLWQPVEWKPAIDGELTASSEGK
jgi:hypothetical protein